MLGILLISLSSAMSANYFFSPNCGHCHQVEPFINQMDKNYPQIKFNFLDVTQGSYAISGTPTLVLNTNDNREITLVGSGEIPKYLECELNEMSTLDCPTTQNLNCETQSFFIR